MLPPDSRQLLLPAELLSPATCVFLCLITLSHWCREFAELTLAAGTRLTLSSPTGVATDLLLLLL
jgi:hypothetical protein